MENRAGVSFSKVISIMVVSVVFMLGSSAFGEKWEAPKAVKVISTDVNSAKFLAAAALCGTIMDSTGVKIRVRPVSKGMSRAELMRSGAADFDFGGVPEHYYMAHGEQTYNKDNWGPQQLRTIWIVYPLTFGYMVRGDSGIKKWADLDGKKVPDFGLYASLNTYVGAGLGSFGEGVKYIKVPVSGYKEGNRAVLEGALDMCHSTSQTPIAKELEAGPHGIGWLETPHSDKEKWAKFQKIAPFLFPVLGTKGAGMSKEHPIETWGGCDRFYSYSWADENFVYWFTKQIDLAIPKSKNLHPNIKDWSRADPLNLQQAMSPYHPGAIKYFKEIGIWGAKEEKWQKERLAQERELIQAWKMKHPSWKYNTGGK